MTFRNNIGPDAVAAPTLTPSAFEPGLAPFRRYVVDNSGYPRRLRVHGYLAAGVARLKPCRGHSLVDENPI